MTQNTMKAASDPHGKSAVPERKKKRGLGVFFLVAAVLFFAVAVLGVYSRNARTTDLQRHADAAARLVVRVVHPEMGSGMIRLQLPGQTTPFTDAPIIAQTNGY